MKNVYVVSLFAFVFLGLLACEPQEMPAEAEASVTEVMAEEARQRLEVNEGGQLVLKSIEAHGGLEAWYNARTSSYSWEYANVDMDFRFKSHMVVDNHTRQAYHDLLELGTHSEAKPVSGQFAWDGKDAWISPDTLKQPNPRFWATTGYYFESIPFILADPGISYERVPDEELDGVMYDRVDISYGVGVGDSPGDIYMLYVNKETALVDAIRYTVTYGQSKEEAMQQESPRETLFYYKDYVTVDGLTVATYFNGHHFKDGEIIAPKNDAWATDISFSKPFDEIRLAMPEEGRVQPMN
ncbi:MAG: hypothetical protein KTR29_13645 [Rhodothermaceae bacterium]|nr:hypothetical protein [Rhodothermaceae bacterium]